MEPRDPKEIIIFDRCGKERRFILSMFPAWDGFKIIERLPAGFMTMAIPKISDWDGLDDLKLRIAKYIYVEINGKYLSLSTIALIDNHCGDSKTFAQLLYAEVMYNNDFFTGETLSDFFAEACRVAFTKISEILTQSSAPSSQTEKPPSTN